MTLLRRGDRIWVIYKGEIYKAGVESGYIRVRIPAEIPGSSAAGSQELDCPLGPGTDDRPQLFEDEFAARAHLVARRKLEANRLEAELNRVRAEIGQLERGPLTEGGNE